MHNTKIVKGYLYSNMKRCRRNLIFITIILYALFFVYTNSIMPYLMAKAYGPSPLDFERFINDVDTFYVSPSNETEHEYVIDPIPSSTNPDDTYWQGDKYLFNIDIRNTVFSGLSYTVDGYVYYENDDLELDPIAFQIDFLKAGEINIPIVYIPTYNEPLKGVYNGIIVKTPSTVKEHLPEFVDEKISVAEYMIDIRGFGMGNENSHSYVWLIYFGILIFFTYRITKYFIAPFTHPVYSQLKQYGELVYIVMDIESQIKKPKSTEKNKICTEDWIIEKTIFGIKVRKTTLSM